MPPTVPIVSCQDLEKRLRNAEQCKLPPYNWIPPAWSELSESRRFNDTCSGPTRFEEPSVDKDRKELEQLCREILHHPNPKVPHPFDDFRHVDPDQFSDTDIRAIEDVPAVLDKVPPQGMTENERAMLKANMATHLAPSLTKLRDLAGARAAGMGRLDTLFKWIICRAFTLLSELNRALTHGDENGYATARERYLSFLRDLDDREPETKSGPGVDEIGRGQRGYGRVIKWAYFDPVIVGGKIVGLHLIVHWNPHSSSSGVPIIH